MFTSVIGYPRIGSGRELKFSEEKYFRNEISSQELEKTAAEIRRAQWEKQRRAGVDFIPSNDFSLYDQFLDTAVMFQMIPERYRKLQLSPLDTYFAMARGYQGAEGDVKALAMKKWFHTNYHYMVAEMEDDMELKFTGGKPLEEYLEAKQMGIETKPVVIGPFTLLKMCHYCGKKREKDFMEELALAYGELVKQFQQLGTEWLAFDEPSLVRDLTEEDVQLFQSLYTILLREKSDVKILLQTYFGHVRDCYKELMQLPFDGIGLDFLEGAYNIQLIEKYGFPKDRLLFAGLVNGKNIWKNEYEKTLKVLSKLENQGIEVVLSASCSFLHIPYSLKQEYSLPVLYKWHFSFAEEKLEEMKELKILKDTSYEQHPAYINNAVLFQMSRINSCDSAVQKRISEIREDDFIRKPDFAEREKIQKEIFQLPLFPTTTIGSFPQTADVKKNRSEYKKKKISLEQYISFNRKKIKECVEWQEKNGLDVLVHGEYERNDMVEYFGEQLNGFLFTQNAWVQSYGTRCVKPPIIWGDISRRGPMTVEWSVYAQSLTKKPVKGMLTGPVTILNWSFPREDISLEACACQIALAIRDEVLDLEKNGIRIIQIDEAALREKLPLRKEDWESGYLKWAIPAFRLVHSKVRPETQIHTHMCYSDFTDIIPAIDAMDADVITFEASRSNLQILDSLQENHFRTEVGPGVYDIHSPRVPSVEEIKSALNLMLQKIEPSKLWVNPDCGLKTRGVCETEASLKNLVKAAQTVRNENSRII